MPKTNYNWYRAHRHQLAELMPRYNAQEMVSRRQELFSKVVKCDCGGSYMLCEEFLHRMNVKHKTFVNAERAIASMLPNHSLSLNK